MPRSGRVRTAVVVLALGLSVAAAAEPGSPQPAPAREAVALPAPPAQRQAPNAEHLRESQLAVAGLASYSTVEGSSVAAGTSPRWQSLGPGNIGGRTRGLVADPRDGRVLLAGAAGGGVWKTTDGGASWRSVFDDQPALTVSALALSPSNPDVVYAGTGEATSTGGHPPGGGVFRSTDAGETWRRVGQFAGIGDVLNEVRDLAVSPTDPDVAYVATARGLYRVDADNPLPTKLVDSERHPFGCSSVRAFVSGTTDTVLSTCGTRDMRPPDMRTSIYRIPDATHATASPDTGPEAVLDPLPSMRVVLAVAPSDPQMVYALATNSFDGFYLEGFHSLWRSTAAGAPGSWERRAFYGDGDPLTRVLLSYTVKAFARECGFGPTPSYRGQGFYAMMLTVDPVNSDRVWVGGVDLFRSDDGGRSWGMASSFMDDRIPEYVHADQHTMVFPAGYDGVTNTTAYVGNDGGVYRTTDATAPTTPPGRVVCDPAAPGMSWEPMNHGYAATQFYDGSVMTSGRYVGGTHDNGVVRGDDTAGHDGWRSPTGAADNFTTTAVPGEPDSFVTFDLGGTMRRFADGTVIAPDAAIRSQYGEWMAQDSPLRFDPHTLGAWTGSHFIWRSDNGARSFTRASTGDGYTPYAVDVAPAPLDPDVVLNARVRGPGVAIVSVDRTERGRAAGPDTVWERNAVPQPFEVLEWDPREAGLVYGLTQMFTVYRSTDSGRTWTELAPRPPGTHMFTAGAWDLRVDPVHRHRLYVATGLGLFVSVDSGVTWQREDGVPAAPTMALDVERTPTGGIVYAFTHGRGVFRTALGDTVPGGPTAVVAAPSPTGVTVSWQPPVDDGGQPISAYVLRAEPSGMTSTVTAETRSAELAGASITDRITVVAVNGLGSGGASEATAAPRPAAVLGSTPPVDVQAEAVSGGVRVTWAPPASTGTTPVRAYRVAVGSGLGVEVSPVTRSTVVTGLPGGRAVARVWAVTEAGHGEVAFAAPVTVTGGSVPPPAPDGGPGAGVTLGADVSPVTSGNMPRLLGRAADYAGRALAGRNVTLMAKPYGSPGYTSVPLEAPVTTDADGRFAIAVRPERQTAYVARVDNVASTAAVVAVFARVNLDRSAAGAVVPRSYAFRGDLDPNAADFRGAAVGLGLVRTDALGQTTVTVIGQTLTRSDSSATYTLTAPRGLPLGTNTYVVFTSARNGLMKGVASLRLTVR